MYLDFIGKIFFPHQQEWQRQRNARIMTYVVIVSVVIGLLLVVAFKLMNAKH